MDKKKKIILIISITILIILGIISTTIAYFGWIAEEEAIVNVTVASGTGECSIKHDNNIFIEPSLTRNGGRIIKLNARQEIGSKAIITWNVVVKKINELQDATFKYEMINTSTGASYGSGDFENISTGSTITFSNSNEVLGFNIDYEFVLYLWIDGTIGNNSLDMANQLLDFDINCNITGVEQGEISLPKGNLSTYITNLYKTANPVQITQPEIGDKYYYASSANLMNDGLDSKGNSTNSMTEGNIRYYGKNPDNYIYFNCSDYDNQSSTTCETWRIIGVVDGKVKIIKDESIGDYYWDEYTDDEASNDWSKASLQNTLNNGTYYNSLRTKNIETLTLISNHTWNLGGFQSGYNSPIVTYKAERGELVYEGRPENWSGKIALMYPSDYMYAADLSVCGEKQYSFGDTTNCYGTDWLFNGKSQWVLTPNYEDPSDVWRILPSGSFSDSLSIVSLHSCSVRPTLYLDKDVAMYGGDGSIDNPYKINRPTAADYIKDIYESANPTLITQKESGYKNYYANDVNLMNDGHDADGNETNNKIDGNIRYYGKNPNNYIYFNCDDYSNQSSSTCEKWRIIGVIDGKLKIIRNSTIGQYAWDNKPNGIGSSTSSIGSNNWSDSRLMMLLNDSNIKVPSEIYNYEDAIYWYGEDGTCYSGESNGTKECHFTTISETPGIKNDATRNYISTSTWYIGNISSGSYYAAEAYKNERKNQITWNGEIAVPNVSDYLYSADIKNCRLGYYYSDKACKSTNWMYNIITNNGNSRAWILAKNSLSNDKSACIYQSGGLDYSFYVYKEYNVVPTLYLNNDVVITSGNGNYDTPYQLLA